MSNDASHTIRFTKDHEWVLMESETAIIGITDYAQSELGDVVFVELPKVGDTISQGKTFGVVESVKAASDLYAPVSGDVLEVNEALQDTPDLVNREPLGDGWMLKVRASRSSEASSLMDASEYADYIKTLH